MPHHRIPVPARRIRAGPPQLHVVLAVRAGVRVCGEQQTKVRGRNVVIQRGVQVQGVQRVQVGVAAGAGV
jgi:hypothetical protein